VKAVRLQLPAGHEAGVRSSLVGAAGFAVEDLPDHWVAIEPAEGAGTVAPYFSPHRLADATTDLDRPEIWRSISEHRPWAQKPEVQLSPEQQNQLAGLYARDDVVAVVQRLGVASVQADAAALPGVIRQELPRLFELYPNGSLWYVSVDQRLLARLSAMRIRFQLTLTPEVDYADEARDRVQYFGLHTTTGGLNFGNAVDPMLLAIAPTALGFGIGVLPHALVFLYGAFEDLRRPNLAERTVREDVPGVVELRGGGPVM
jgi:hypothetical protein